MFTNPYLYLLAGMLVYFLLDLGTFFRSANINFNTAFWQYLKLNVIYMVAGAIAGLTIVSLLSIGKLTFLAGFGFDVNASPESAFVLGLLNQWVLIKLRKFINATSTQIGVNAAGKTEVVTKKSEVAGTHPKFPNPMDQF